jgi:hypothetical protein
MLCLEIWGRELLLNGNDKEVQRQLSEGDYPDRPGSIPSEIWNVMVKCWTNVPEHRPTISEVVSSLQQIRARTSPPSKYCLMFILL